MKVFKLFTCYCTNLKFFSITISVGYLHSVSGRWVCVNCAIWYTFCEVIYENHISLRLCRNIAKLNQAVFMSKVEFDWRLHSAKCLSPARGSYRIVLRTAALLIHVFSILIADKIGLSFYFVSYRLDKIIFCVTFGAALVLL